MSSKKTDNTLLLPGAKGWEVWSGANDAGFQLTLQSDSYKASELDKFPSSKLIMGFPIREVLAVPFHVQTDNEEMFTDLSEMHLEKSAIRPEEGAGVLTDVFIAGKHESDSQLLSVVLSAPAPDTMPLTSPSSFDVSARFYNFVPNTATLWRELGRWGFAISGADRGGLTYFQALSSDDLGKDAVRDIKLALMQLKMQGVQLNLDKVIVWLEGDEFDPADDTLRVFAEDLEALVSTEPKPKPQIPQTLSKLLPEDVQAEQRKKAEALKRNTMIAACLLLYIGLIAYFAYGYISLKKKMESQEKELAGLKTQHANIGLFNNDWAQLAPVVDSTHWPIILLKRSAESMPSGQDIRFQVFEATRDKVTVRGESAEIGQANSFGEQLKKKLSDYNWSIPPATSDAKTNRWKFNYEGTLEGGTL